MFAEKVWSDETTLRAKSGKIERIKKVHNINVKLVTILFTKWWI